MQGPGEGPPDTGEAVEMGHVQVDMSDRNPCEVGMVRCFKCGAERHFIVGPRGGLHYRRWEKSGKPAPRCRRTDGD